MDGFDVLPQHYPGDLEVFTETVVPILRERGLFRTEYAGTTLRDHFGLQRPESRFAAQPARRDERSGGGLPGYRILSGAVA